MEEEFCSSSSEDEGCGGILKQALEVKISADFNPNSVPRDGKYQIKIEDIK